MRGFRQKSNNFDSIFCYFYSFRTFFQNRIFNSPNSGAISHTFVQLSLRRSPRILWVGKIGAVTKTTLVCQFLCPRTNFTLIKCQHWRQCQQHFKSLPTWRIVKHTRYRRTYHAVSIYGLRNELPPHLPLLNTHSISILALHNRLLSGCMVQRR